MTRKEKIKELKEDKKTYLQLYISGIIIFSFGFIFLMVFWAFGSSIMPGNPLRKIFYIFAIALMFIALWLLFDASEKEKKYKEDVEKYKRQR